MSVGPVGAGTEQSSGSGPEPDAAADAHVDPPSVPDAEPAPEPQPTPEPEIAATSPPPPIAAPRRDGWLREALWASGDIWLGSRIAVLLLSMAAARALSGGPANRVPGVLTLWNRWDVGLFTKVARYGYRSPHYADRTEVDFPGMPLAMRLAHLLVWNWTVAGLLVSLVAGGFAAAAIWRLSADELDGSRARFAVLSMVLFPYAVFLFAGYSEAIFLGFAAAAWVEARRGRWWLAGLLGAGAASTRVTGIPFCAALAVEYLSARRRAGLPLVARPALSLALPPVPIAAFILYMRARTGTFDFYRDAMRAGWHRGTAWPWVGWRATWNLAWDGSQSSEFVWFWRGELLAVVVGAVVTVLLLRGRRFGEATFVGGATLLMSASTYYASGIRTILVAFPLYLMLARAAGRWRWTVPAYLWIATPVMAAFVVAFSQGQWVD